MENVIVALIVGAAAIYLFGRLRKTFSGKGGCCGCSGTRRRPSLSACSCCSSQQGCDCRNQHTPAA